MYQNSSLTLLHRFSGRRDYLRASERAIVFDAGLNSWVVLDPDLAAAALTEPRLAQVDYAAANAGLAEATGLDLPNIAFALAHNPISRDGPQHVRQRKAAARHLADHRRAADEAMTAAVARHASRFDEAGEVEVMAEIVVPMVNAVIGGVLGVRISGDEPASTMSRLFDRLGSARRQTEVDREIGHALARLQSAGAADGDEGNGAALSLWILGYDATIGTLGESLRHLFQKHSGSPLRDIPFPDNPPETGVAYVGRTAKVDFEFGGAMLKAGQRVRVTLQSSAYSDDPKRQARMFGAGAHTCVGRPLAFDLWRSLTARLRSAERRVEFINSQLREQDYLFVYPAFLKVRLA